MPADAKRVLVVGDIAIELAGRSVSRMRGPRPSENGSASSNGKRFDAAVVELFGGDAPATLRSVAARVRPGGAIVGTAPAARNRRRMEDLISTVVTDGVWSSVPSAAGGTNRRELLDDLAGAGLDARSLTIVRDGWLTPVALRPDGSGSVVESEEFLLKNVAADAAEELAAEEFVFAAVRTSAAKSREPSCSIVVVAVADADPQRFADALSATETAQDYELVVVASQAPEHAVRGRALGARARVSRAGGAMECRRARRRRRAARIRLRRGDAAARLARRPRRHVSQPPRHRMRRQQDRRRGRDDRARGSRARPRARPLPSLRGRAHRRRLREPAADHARRPRRGHGHLPGAVRRDRRLRRDARRGSRRRRLLHALAGSRMPRPLRALGGTAVAAASGAGHAQRRSGAPPASSRRAGRRRRSARTCSCARPTIATATASGTARGASLARRSPAPAGCRPSRGAAISWRTAATPRRRSPPSRRSTTPAST